MCKFEHPHKPERNIILISSLLICIHPCTKQFQTIQIVGCNVKAERKINTSARNNCFRKL